MNGAQSIGTVGKLPIDSKIANINELISKIQISDSTNVQSSLLDSIQLTHAILYLQDISKSNSKLIEDFINILETEIKTISRDNITPEEFVQHVISMWIPKGKLDGNDNIQSKLINVMSPLISSRNFENDIKTFIDELKSRKEREIIKGGITLQLTKDKYMKKLKTQVDIVINKFTNGVLTKFEKISELLKNIFEKLNKNGSEMRFNIDELLNSLEDIGNIFEKNSRFSLY